MEQVEIQRIGDGRIIMDGKTYCNESSNRVLTIKERDEYFKLKKLASDGDLADVVGRSEQLLALAQYMCEHQNNLDGKTAKDYLQDFLSQ